MSGAGQAENEGTTAVREGFAFDEASLARWMGAHVEGFVEAITIVAQQFDPEFDAATIEQRPSKGGNYLGLTITVTATSREQLDELYRTLTTHPMVKVVL